MPAPEFVALADVLRAAAGPGPSSFVPGFSALEDAAELEPTARTDEAGIARMQAAHAGVTTVEIKHRDGAARTDPPQDALACDVPQLDIGAVAREARLFRARLADALDDALARLLREIAADVLARELRLAPCDVAEIARRALERAPVVRLRVAPAEAGGDYGLPVVVDPALHAGDAVFELDGGAFDARLGVRLASVLDAVWSAAR